MKTLSMFAIFTLALVVELFPFPAYAENVDCSQMMTEEATARCEAEKSATKVVAPTTPNKVPRVSVPVTHTGFTLSSAWIIGLLVATLILSVVINLILLRKLQGNVAGAYSTLVNALLRKKVIDQNDILPP